MALVTPSTDVRIDGGSAMHSNQIPNLVGLKAGEALLPAAPCYIKSSDNKVYLSNGTAANEAAEVIGFTGKAYAADSPVTLFPPDTVYYYSDDFSGASIAPGDILYLGTTKGRLDTAATTGDGEGIAQVLDDNHILFLRRKEGTAAADALAGVVAGTVAASKVVVVDASKDIGDFRNVDAVNIDAGASGTAGSVDVFPATAAKGKVSITAADSAGDTTTTIVNASQAGARTYTIPDAGAAASFVMTEGAQTVNGVKTFGAIPVLPASGVTLGTTTLTEALLGKYVGAPAAGYRIARGVAAVTGTATVATSLTTVVAVIATAQDDLDGDALAGVSATIGDQAGTPAAGSVILKCWKVTADGDVTFIAANAAKNVNWIAIGT